ncbi:response regulator receiver protein [Methylobacterium sp. WCS2018Hpa-22]|uniref:response regulator receiver protein n=1 Tax=Methylobacterium sp. WCS2018Hpa-22 TaxID=3073633 RepID=UPI00288C5465|nr:response regulator receiver protein [Methylobacterium sp. WCS2018Hpa-22]
MSLTPHSIVAPFDMGGQGLAGVLFRARQDRIALQAQADAVQAERNVNAVQRTLNVMGVLGRLVLAFRAENTALEQTNAALKADLARMRSRALEAEGRLTRAAKEGRLRAA